MVDWLYDPDDVSLGDLGDVDTSTTPPDDGQALVFDDGSGLWVPGDGSGGSIGVVNIVAASGATLTLDLADGDWHDVTLTANCTFTFAGATAGQGDSFLLILRQDGTGGRTVTWPASVSWPDDTPPTLSTDPNDVDILAFYTHDGGTTWFGTYHGGGGGGAVTPEQVRDAGRWEVIVSGSPPVATTNETEDDWVYGWVDD